MPKFFYLACFIVLLQACSAIDLINSQSAIQKSPNDKKEYRAITLSNRLPVLLISDPDSVKAAAAMDVSVGSAHDPAEFEGLAHFLEHMLFLGTEKYPEPDAYQKFISEHGGSHNAFTAQEHTNYFFDVDARHLEGALDRFSQQFTAPLFNEKYVEREKNAVHSEFSSKLKDDGRRYFAALKQTLAPQHPYSSFSVGNLSTLADKEDQTVREALLDFYHDQYSANVMRLVIYGNEPLDQLEAWATEKFSNIPNIDKEPNRIQEPFFASNALPKKLEVDSIKDKNSMTIAFPIPSGFDHNDSKPIYYLSNLLGHEGNGSLLSELKKAELVNSLASGAMFDTKKQAILSLRMDLTPKGLESQELILEHVFSYINLIKSEGIKPLYFQEQKQLLDISFKFVEQSEPIHYVSSLANQLQDYPAQTVLVRGYQLDNYAPALYREFLESLRPDNMLVAVSFQGLESDTSTEWYDGKYKISKIDNKLIEKLENQEILKNLALPTKNIFIPEKTDLLDIASHTKPERIFEEDGLVLWYSPDLSFGTPKANLFITLRSPIANSSALNANRIELMAALLKDTLTEFTYPAYLAGLNYELYDHMRGITIKISGYDDKQKELLNEILKVVMNTEFAADRFAITKERLRRSLLNAKDKKPYDQAITKTRRMLLTPSWDEAERLEALDKINLESLQQFKSDFLSQLDVAILASGNINEESARIIKTNLQTTLLSQVKPIKVERAKMRKLVGNKQWAHAFQVKHPDTGYVLYIQGDNKTFEERAKLMVLSQTLSSDYYTEIRTEKQLGYVVFATNFNVLEVPALAFIVQSPSASGNTLKSETEAFLTSHLDVLKELSPEKLESNKQAVITRLSKKENTIYEKSNRYWLEIDQENFDFNTRDQLIERVGNVTAENLFSYYENLIAKQGNRLTVTTFSKDDSDSPENNDEKLGELNYF